MKLLLSKIPAHGLYLASIVIAFAENFILQSWFTQSTQIALVWWQEGLIDLTIGITSMYLGNNIYNLTPIKKEDTLPDLPDFVNEYWKGLIKLQYSALITFVMHIIKLYVLTNYNA
jgi:hypothetical protein